MTSDDELLRQQLKYGPHHAELSAKALDRIRELEAELEEADRQAKKLEALVEKVVAWEGKEPTHTIVPVEPTPEMIEASYKAGSWNGDIYRAMIRASQESK